MKKGLLLLLLSISSVVCFSQTQSDATISTQIINTIRCCGYSNGSAGNLYQTLTDSKVSILGSYSNPSWITSLAASKVLPSQTSQSGKYLTTDGTNLSWATVSGGGITNSAPYTYIMMSNGTNAVSSGVTIPSTGNISATSITTSSGIIALNSQFSVGGSGSGIMNYDIGSNGTLTLGGGTGINTTAIKTIAYNNPTSTMSLLIATGDALSTNNNSGNVYIDNGNKAGTGTIGNVSFFDRTGSFGSAQKTIFVGNAVANPSTSVTGGFLLYANSSNSHPTLRYGTTDLDLTTVGSGSVSSVSGTSNRITSTGGTTPTIDISSTFEALLGKIANPLSQFSSTTSSQLAGVILDETGTGSLVFSNSPSFTTPNIGNATGSISGNAATVTTNANLTGDVTGSGNTTTVTKLNGTSLAGLSTGLLKITTSTGIPSTAIPGTDYIAPYASQTANTFFGAPNGSSGTPTFRILASADIPNNASNTTGTSSNITGVAAVANGGTGSATAAINTIFSGPSSGSTGAPSFRSQVIADLPYNEFITDATTARTLSASDRGKIIRFTSASAITVTLPTGITQGFECVLVKTAAGDITLSAGTLEGASVISGSTPSFAVIINRGSDIWMTNGTGVTSLTGVSTIDSQTKSANGAVATGANLYLQTADASNPGLVSTVAQTFAGAKTFPRIVLGAGTASAATGPLQFTSGTNMTTAEVGTVEYDGTDLFFTNGGAQRQRIPQVQPSRVTTQFDVTSSTTLANITGLTSTLVAGKVYRFEATLYTTSNVAGGVKFSIAGTATATSVIYETIVIDANVNAAQTRATALAASVGAVTAVTNAYTKITGLITVNAAGTLTVQFAQNVSNGTPSSVLVGSNLIVTQQN